MNSQSAESNAGVVAIALIATASSVFACADEKKDYPAITVSSIAFGQEETIPLRHTCDSSNISPPLAFDDIPKKVQSFAVVMDEPEAEGGRFTHWLLWDIPVGSSYVTEAVPKTANPDDTLVQGINDAETIGYTGPCPGEEDFAEHRYVIRVYGLDVPLDLAAEADRDSLHKAMQGHIVGYGKLVGYYRREP